jgi:rhamnogalacturonyl hydrolase YesR
MRIHSLLTCIVAVISAAYPDAPNIYSLRMANSIMTRHQGILTSTSDRSNLLQAGFTQKAFRQVIQQYPNESLIASYMHSSVDSVIQTVNNATLDLTYPLDRLSSGNGLIYAYRETKNETYRNTFENLRESIDLQPRNQEGSLWYYTYPNYTYLDGMYSLAPFVTLYASEKGTSAAVVLDDVIRQLDLAWKHTHQPSSGLLVHGYDASKRAVWANNATGASPHVWGRSLGWYCMALLDTLDLLPFSAQAARTWILEHFQTLMKSVVNSADPQTGAWWQVMDMPGRKGNYIESSASAMFVYSLLRGVRMGYLECKAQDYERNDSYVGVANRAYQHLTDTFVVDIGNGTLGWNGTVGVCSLNSSAAYEVCFVLTMSLVGEIEADYRMQYYVGQPILYNNVLGSAAFVLASLEYERRFNVTKG